MSQMGPFKAAVTAALFGLLSTGLVSIGLVKAAYGVPQIALTGPHIADRFQTARSDHLALSDLGASGARIRIAIVDASRRNPYERRFRSYSHGLAPIDADANTIVITATSPEQVVEDAGASPNRFVDGLAAEIAPSPRSVEEVLTARMVAAGRSRREEEILHASGRIERAQLRSSPASNQAPSSRENDHEQKNVVDP
jgi:hypothetical protein